MLTTAVFSSVAMLLVWALLRRPQAICVILAATFIAAVGVSEISHRDHLRPILMGLDGLVVLSMWLLWWRTFSDRAALVATLGFLKIWVGIAAAMSSMSYLAWASANNAIFVVQVLIAGGFADGIIAWLGGCLRGTSHRGLGVLGYMEKLPWQK